MPEVFYGVDVSKDWVDVAGPDGAVRRVAQTPDRLARLAAEAVATEGIVVFEASGPYDRPLRRALDLAGVRYARVNPAQARFFAKGEGVRAKTDRVDARLLRRMGECQTLAITPPESENLSQIRALCARRRQLVALRKVERTRLHAVADPDCRASVATLITWLDAEVARFEAAVAAVIAADPTFRDIAGLLASAPGAGPVTVATLIADCPELGKITGKQAAALTGLAPVANDSGKRQGQRRIGGGRKHLRDLLYMAALGATRADPDLRAFKDRLRDAGKAPKQATLAVARKLITILNAMLRDNHPYKPVQT